MPQRSSLLGSQSMRHGPVTGSSRPLIDIALALDLLTAAVQQRGERFVYPPVVDDERTCLFRDDAAPPTLVEHALTQIPLNAADVAVLHNRRIRELHAQGRLPIRPTLGALLVFDIAQRSEDRGLTWGETLDEARKVVVRYIDILPNSAFDAGVERARLESDSW